MTSASSAFLKVSELVAMVCSELGPVEFPLFAAASPSLYAFAGEVMWGKTRCEGIQKGLTAIKGNDNLTADEAKQLFVRRVGPYVKSLLLTFDDYTEEATPDLPPSLLNATQHLFPNLYNFCFEIVSPPLSFPTAFLFHCLPPALRQLHLISLNPLSATLRSDLRHLLSRLPTLCPKLTHLSVSWYAVCGALEEVNAERDDFVNWEAVSSLQNLHTLEISVFPNLALHNADSLKPMVNLTTLVVRYADLTKLPDFVRRTSATNVRQLSLRHIDNRSDERIYESFFRALCTSLTKLKVLELRETGFFDVPPRSIRPFQELLKHRSLLTLMMPGNTYLWSEEEKKEEELGKLRDMLGGIELLIGWDNQIQLMQVKPELRRQGW